MTADDSKAFDLAQLDRAHAQFVETFKPIPSEALSWLKPGDDYAIGGIVIHLIQSLDGYVATVEAIHGAGYTDTAGPGEDAAVIDEQLARARHGLSGETRAATFDELRRKHAALRMAADRADEAQFDALVGLLYPDDDVPNATSVALVVRWMTEHYLEHVPHAEVLFAEWKRSR